MSATVPDMNENDNQAYVPDSEDDELYENQETIIEAQSKNNDKPKPLRRPTVHFAIIDEPSPASGDQTNTGLPNVDDLWDDVDGARQSDFSEEDGELQETGYDLPIGDKVTEDSSTCDDLFSKCQGLIKAIFAFVLGAVILGCLLISKGALLFTASQMHRYVGFKSTGMYNETPVNDGCSSMDDCKQCGVPICVIEGDPQCTQKESVRWIWGMYLIQCTPYLLMTLRCVWKICFKNKKDPTLKVVVCVLTTESIHVLGTFMLLFDVLPFLDVYRGVTILCGVAVIPSFLNILIKNENGSNIVKLVLDVVAVIGQVSALFLMLFFTETNNWDYTWNDVCGDNNSTFLHNNYSFEEVYYFATANINSTTTERPVIKYEYAQTNILPETVTDIWKVPLALLFISIGYWENFVGDNSVEFFINLRHEVMLGSTKIYAFAGLWKILFTFLLVLFHFGMTNETIDIEMLFATSNLYENKCSVSEGAKIDNFQSDWLVVAIIQIFVGIMCFYISDLAIKGQLQIPGFTIPLAIATPLTFLLMFWPCNECDDSFDLETAYYWNCNAGYRNSGEGITRQYSWLGLVLWWPSFLLVTRYLLTPKIERLAKTEKIFCHHFPCGALLEQSLMLMRRRQDTEFKKGHGTSRRPSSMILDGVDRTRNRVAHIENDQDNLQAPYVPTLKCTNRGNTFIYFCATMWHETAQEMLQIMGSIFKMNNDQTRRQWVRDYGQLQDMDQDFYQFEVHVFFDDAFEADEKDDSKLILNSFVNLFVKTVGKAASAVLRGKYDIGEPVKYDTPYGGRLEWSMPFGENKIILHLKNKEKVRKGKRWSQIMYMHYILGQSIKSQKVKEKKLKDVAENTYILALDGDVDFKPEAVLMLLDLMKRNTKVAAACGRIHPLGGGPMVWYQKFEYSISHWLQKATEHILGCVLCSPGCFSLFRTSALMDVAGTYGIIAHKPQHKVQYDQGEDRWLCTLLLQKGYRVEYSAASDAFTFAPERFDEFFNQRRRWITSTFANLIDLLGSAMKTTKTNENISMLYMIYQGILFVSSMLGPATIFLLIIGTIDFIINYSETHLAFVWILLIGITPFVIFMILCFIGEKKTQLYFASLFSTILAVIQILVLVGLLSQMIQKGFCSPTTIFFLIVVGTFVLAACIHPQEFTNLFHLFVFYLFVPSTYLLLIIYALCNINDVSWGTRDTIPSKTDKQNDQKQHEEAAKDPKSWTDHIWSSMTSTKETGNSGCSLTCTPLFGCRCCITPGQSETDKRFEETTKAIAVLGKEIIELKEEIRGQNKTDGTPEDIQIQMDPQKDDQQPSTSKQDHVNKETKTRSWSCNFPEGTLDQHEYSFWNGLVTSDDFLKPIDMTDSEKDKMIIEMKELRNKCVFAFFMIDILLIVLILGLKQTSITIEWECGGGTQTNELDPIGLTFIIVFGFVIALQLIGMLLHRLFTFLQLISTAVICKSNEEQKAENEHKEINTTQIQEDLPNMDQKDVLMIMKQVQRIDFEEDDDDNMSVVSRASSLEDQFPTDNEAPIRFKRRYQKRTKVYNRKKLDQEIAARLIALGKAVETNQGDISNDEEQELRDRHQQTGGMGRRPSQYQKAMTHMKQRKSFSINPDNVNMLKSKHKIDDKDIQKQNKIINSIMNKKGNYRKPSVSASNITETRI